MGAVDAVTPPQIFEACWRSTLDATGRSTHLVSQPLINCSVSPALLSAPFAVSAPPSCALLPLPKMTDVTKRGIPLPP